MSEKMPDRGFPSALLPASVALLILLCRTPVLQAEPSYSPNVADDFPTRLLWGDAHLHTNMSPDAASLGNRDIGPEQAYRFARGETVAGQNGMPIRLGRALDFLVIADHSEYLGLFPRLAARDPVLLATETGRRWSHYISGEADSQAFIDEWIRATSNNQDVIGSDEFRRSVWDEVIASAERNNDPGHFTALIGYEWSSMPGGDNLHRVVIFGDGADKVGSVLPFSSIDSNDPEELWKYLEHYEQRSGGTVIAIPHNSNTSGGLMFGPENFGGKPLDADYAARRQRWEPVVEATQYKGDSETHPLLSPDDAFADYETWDRANIGMRMPQTPQMQPYQYVRSGLKLGLQYEATLGVNPFRFGLIGGTDSHTGFATAEEDNFWGKMSRSEPAADRWSRPLLRLEAHPELEIPEWRMAASGYAAVWARDNTRAEILAALKRREVYATTGTRIGLRFFGGTSFRRDDAYRADMARKGYRAGVAMGGVIDRIGDGARPRFLVQAARDPRGANLDRIQVVKGWLGADGQLRERIYDVAVSDGRKISAEGVVDRAVGSTVDVEHASYRNTIGAAELLAFWEDPDFDSVTHAFYYVRVLEIPTPRWTAYDAAYFKVKMDPEVPMVQQERAYSSPIWYRP